MDSIIPFVAGTIFGVVLGVGVALFVRSRLQNDEYSSDDRLEDDLTEARERVESLNKDVLSLSKELAASEEKVKAANDQIDSQRGLIDDFKKKILDEFSSASAKAMLNNNKAFNDQAEQNMKPLRESLEAQRKYIESLQQERAGQVKALESLVEVVRSNANELVTAMKKSDARGAWGETQLRRIVEHAGMVDKCHFDTQKTYKDMDGDLRPDMVINLPNGGKIVVDSKVNLNSYLEYSSEESPSVREELLQKHMNAVKATSKSLSGKDYQKQVDSPDFVVMFVPVESAFHLAIKQSPTLFEDALKGNVLIASPITLIALLKTIAYGWRQEKVAQSAKKISDVGKLLYERINTFIDKFEKIGRGIQTASRAYDDSIGTLEGQIMSRSKNLESLGVGLGKDTEEKKIEPLDYTPRQIGRAETGTNED